MPTTMIQRLQDKVNSIRKLEANSTMNLPPILPRVVANTELSKLVHKMRQDKINKERTRKCISLNEQEELCQVLLKNSVKKANVYLISYKMFLKSRDELDEKFKWLFRASTFAEFPKNDEGLMSIRAFHSYVARVSSLLDTYCELHSYSFSMKGYLTKEELEQYIRDLIPSLKLPSQSKNMFEYYIITVIRKFRFFHDKSRQSKYKIEEILFSPVLAELLELKQEGIDPEELESSWFSVESIQRLYNIFTSLNHSKTGMLTRREASGIYEGNLTKLFLDRAFQNVQLFNGKMDYLSYLDLIIALENADKPEGVHWIFRVLDIKEDGFLDKSTIAYFVKEAHTRMVVSGLDPIKEQDMLNEIFDLVNPKDPNLITVHGKLY